MENPDSAAQVPKQTLKENLLTGAGYGLIPAIGLFVITSGWPLRWRLLAGACGFLLEVVWGLMESYPEVIVQKFKRAGKGIIHFINYGNVILRSVFILFLLWGAYRFAGADKWLVVLPIILFAGFLVYALVWALRHEWIDYALVTKKVGGIQT